MPKPSMIQLLIDIWREEIQSDYRKGIIINERTLQAALYHYLRQRKPELHVVAEVKRFMMRDAPGIPDLVVCSGGLGKKPGLVEVVVELKCFPGRLGYRSDIKKLATWASEVHSRAGIQDCFHIDPGTLNWADYKNDKYKWFRFTDQTQWVYAPIGEREKNEVGAFSLDALKTAVPKQDQDRVPLGNFWLLFGKTSGNAKKRDTEFGFKQFRSDTLSSLPRTTASTEGFAHL